MELIKKEFESFEVVDLVLNDDFKNLVSEMGDTNLMGYIKNSEGHEKEIRLASSIIIGIQQKNKFQSLELKFRLWKRIKNNHQKQKRYLIARYAAMLVLFLSLGGGTLFFIHQSPGIIELAKTNPVEYDQFKIILPDGKNIFLTGNVPVVKSVEEGKTILLNDSIIVNQKYSNGYNQLVVPYGRRGTVLLADGTEISLNSGSRLVFPTFFSGNRREVYLEGEGFFKVKKNADKPFYVQTDKFKVQVVGTSFNVQAYKMENLYNTMLVEGKVNMRQNDGIFPSMVELLPNQIASLSNSHDQIKVETITSTKEYISWVDGYLEFDNENIDNLLKKISMYYNIKIDMKTGTRLLKINGKLDLMDNAEKVIAGLAEMAKLRYRKQGENNYTLYE